MQPAFAVPHVGPIVTNSPPEELDMDGSTTPDLNEHEHKAVVAGASRFARHADRFFRVFAEELITRDMRHLTERQRLFATGFITAVEIDRRFGIISYGDDTEWRILEDDPATGAAADNSPRLTATEKARKILDAPLGRHNAIHSDYLCPNFEVREGLVAEFLWIRHIYAIINPRTGATYRGSGPMKEIAKPLRPLVIELDSNPNWRARDREFQTANFGVARFSGPELVNDPYACAVEAERILGRFIGERTEE